MKKCDVGLKQWYCRKGCISKMPVLCKSARHFLATRRSAYPSVRFRRSLQGLQGRLLLLPMLGCFPRHSVGICLEAKMLPVGERGVNESLKKVDMSAWSAGQLVGIFMDFSDLSMEDIRKINADALGNGLTLVPLDSTLHGFFRFFRKSLRSFRSSQSF